MGSIEVYILGQKYTIRGDESPEYIKQLANYVDSKLKEVCSNTPNLTPLKAVILASLNIADEFHKLKNEYNAITSNLSNIGQKTDFLLEIVDSE
ncbi:MAG: cell division protein ZapA [Thermodesulfovibrionales bacterium]|nr:cell division protein ZapA [Thermodesulfovibrionales bacterium]